MSPEQLYKVQFSLIIQSWDYKQIKMEKHRRDNEETEMLVMETQESGEYVKIGKRDIGGIWGKE
jgi:hypothetical protein